MHLAVFVFSLGVITQEFGRSCVLEWTKEGNRALRRAEAIPTDFIILDFEDRSTVESRIGTVWKCSRMGGLSSVGWSDP